MRYVGMPGFYKISITLDFDPCLKVRVIFQLIKIYDMN